VPVKALLLRYRYVSFVNVDICGGIVPVRALSERYRYFRFTRVEMAAGIVPWS
jgi:hypothetical protein